MDPIVVAYYSLVTNKITKRWIFNPSSEMPKYTKTPPAEIEALFASKRRGSHEDLFADIDLEAPPVPAEKTVTLRTTGAPTLLPPITISGEAIEIVKDVFVYEYDRVYEMLLKISMVTGVPYYRLHADYIDETGHPTGTYRLFAGGPYDCSLLTYGTHEGMIKVADGVYVDKYIYDIRHDTRVYALDTFRIARGVRYVLIADMNEVTTRATFDDKYTTELIYYGFILKYFPAMTMEVFNEYIRSESNLPSKFPELVPAHLRGRFNVERDVIKSMNREKKHDDILTAISRCMVTMTAPGPLNLRNIFDAISTTSRGTTETFIPEVHYFVKTGAVVTTFSKIHHGIKPRQVPNQQILKQGVTIVVLRAEGGHDPIYVSFHANGKVYVKLSFAEEDFVSFIDIPGLVEKYVGSIISTVNTLGVKASPNGTISMTSPPPAFDAITANLFWKKIITETQFRDLIKSFEKFISAGILGHYDVVNLAKDSHLYIFRKGTYQFDGTLINRVLIKAGKGDVMNQFAYLTNPVIRSKWMEMYSGRVINVSHRASDVSIEISDAQASEFELFCNIATNMLSSSNVASSNNSIMNVKNSLSKAREQDPVLFNLKKAGYPVVYARLCQKKMQPVVYQEDEYNALPETMKKKMTKYKNFTYNRPAYYMCPGSQYKHLNFIAGVHPAGYCLPCCFKTAISDKERKARVVFDSCTKTFHGPDDLVSDSRHILAINKTLDPGRVGQLPDIVKKIAPRDAYMFGVTQYFKGTFCPLLFIAASAVYEGSLTDGKVTINGKTIRSPDQPDIVTPFINSLYSRLKKSGSVYMPDVRPESIIEAFSGDLFNSSDVNWEDVLTRSLSVFWGISLIIVDDDDVNIPARGSLSERVIIIVKRMYTRESSVNNAGPAWYPLVQISDEYFKSGLVLKMVFELSKDMDAFADAIETYDKADDARANKVATADAILEFVSGTKRVEYVKYIGRGNKVYAIHVTSGAYAGLKIPVPYDDYSSGVEKVSFAPIVFDTPAETIKKLVSSFDMPGYQPLVATGVIRCDEVDGYIGAIVNDMFFQHLPITKSPFIAASWNLTERTKTVSMPPDKVIAASLKGATDIAATSIAGSLYKYYVYDLALMQVVEEIRKSRDDVIHKKLHDTFAAIKTRTEIPKVMKSISDIIPRGSEDFNKIIAAIESVPRGTDGIASAIDAVILLSDEAAANAKITPQGISDAFSMSCIRGKVTIKSFPNVYEACGSGTPQEYCNSSGRLIIDVDDDYWGRLPGLIYEDLSNPIKRPYLMDRLYYDNIIDEFSYTVNDDESLFIRKK